MLQNKVEPSEYSLVNLDILSELLQIPADGAAHACTARIREHYDALSVRLSLSSPLVLQP